MRNRLSTSLAMLILLFTGQAYADTPVLTAACPRPEAIEQTATDNGYVYQASIPGMGYWMGENPETQKPYKVAFDSASYKDSTQAIICDYLGDGDAAIRLTLKGVQNWKPSPDTDWKDGFCQSREANRCGFEYSAVTDAQ